MRASLSLRIVAPLLTFVLLAALVGGAVTTRFSHADARSGGPLTVAGLPSPSPLADSRAPRSPRPGQVVASTPAQTGPTQRPARSERPLNSANAAGSATTASASAVAASDLAAFGSAQAASASAVVVSDTAVASGSAATASGSAATASGSAATASASAGVAASAGAASASAGVVASDAAASASASLGAVASASSAVASNAAANPPPVTQPGVIYTGDQNRVVTVDLTAFVTNLPEAETLTFFDFLTDGCPARDENNTAADAAAGRITVSLFDDNTQCTVRYQVRDAANQSAGGQVTVILGLAPASASASSAAAAASAAAVPASLTVTVGSAQGEPGVAVGVVRGAGLQPGSTVRVGTVLSSGFSGPGFDLPVGDDGTAEGTYRLEGCASYIALTADGTTAAGTSISDTGLVIC
jgi:hypothetical protein